MEDGLDGEESATVLRSQTSLSPSPTRMILVDRHYGSIHSAYNFKKFARIVFGRSSMPNPITRTYRLNTKTLADLMVQRGLTQEQLANHADISTVTLSHMMNGRKAYRKTFGKLAKALNVTDSSTLWIDETVQTPHRGGLAPDGMELYTGTSANESEIIDKIRQIDGRGKPLVMIIWPTGLAILCCLSGFAPIDARYCYLIGTVFAAIGVVSAIKKQGILHLSMKSLFVLPLVAVVLNITAYVAWPRAIGIFPVRGGYTFGVGDRQPGWLAIKPTKRFHPVMFSPALSLNETAEISTDPDAMRWNVIRGDKSGIFLLCFVELETGWNIVSLRRSGMTQRQSVYIDPQFEFTFADPIENENNKMRIRNMFPNAHPIHFQFPTDPAKAQARLLAAIMPFTDPNAEFYVRVNFFRDNNQIEPSDAGLTIQANSVNIRMDHLTHGFRTSSGLNYIKLLYKDIIVHQNMYAFDELNY